MPHFDRRRPNPDAEGLPAMAYVSYADGTRTITRTLDGLAAPVAAAVDSQVEDRYVRAITQAGERLLTRDEQLALLVAMSELKPRR
jgi:hypothetical protein